MKKAYDYKGTEHRKQFSFKRYYHDILYTSVCSNWMLPKTESCYSSQQLKTMCWIHLSRRGKEALHIEENNNEKNPNEILGLTRRAFLYCFWLRRTDRTLNLKSSLHLVCSYHTFSKRKPVPSIEERSYKQSTMFNLQGAKSRRVQGIYICYLWFDHKIHEIIMRTESSYPRRILGKYSNFCIHNSTSV